MLVPGILTAVDFQEQKTFSGAVNRLPPLMSSLYDNMYHAYRAYDEHSLSEECKRVVESDMMDIRESDARYLEEQARLQSECQLWLHH